MNKQNTEFARLETLQGEKFFRRDTISSFGYAETVSTTAPTKHEVRIVYRTSDSSSEDITYRVYDKSKFEEFRDSILDASRKTPAATYDDIAFQDRFPDGIRESSGTARDTLEFSEGVTGLYGWLRDMANNTMTTPANWEFNMESRIRDYDPVIFMCTRTVNQGCSFEVVLRLDINDCQSGEVLNIYPKYHAPLLHYDYNKFLKMFVDEIVKPYAKSAGISYSYSGAPSTPPGDAPDTFSLECKDGLLNFSVKAYMDSDAVREFIDNNPGWIASHTMRDVSDELEELYMK